MSVLASLDTESSVVLLQRVGIDTSCEQEQGQEREQEQEQEQQLEVFNSSPNVARLQRRTSPGLTLIQSRAICAPNDRWRSGQVSDSAADKLASLSWVCSAVPAPALLANRPH